MPNTYEDVLALINTEAAAQKARSGILNASVKENVQKEQDAQNEQLRQLGLENLQKQRNAEAVARNLALITTQLKADPTDPTSLMARNNVAITSFSEKLLNSLNVAAAIEADTSIVGTLGRMFALPDVQKEAAQAKETIAQLHSANSALTQQLNNQTVQLQNAVKLGNTDLAKAEQARAMAIAQAGVAKDGLVTAEGLYRMQSAASTDAIQLAEKAAKAKEDMLLAPLNLAIAKGTAAKYDDEATMDALYANRMGWDKSILKQQKYRMQRDPILSQAIDHFVITGEYLNPDDADIIKPWMIQKNLVYTQDTQRADGSIARSGSPLPALATVMEATRPVIKARVAKLLQEVTDDLRKKQIPETQIAKQLANPGTRRELLREFAEKNKARSEEVESDLISANPNYIFNQLPRLAEAAPIIRAIATNLGNTAVDIPPTELLKLMLKGNMNLSDALLAEQAATYFQNVLALDRGRAIYQQLGIKAANSARLLTQRVSMPKAVINVLLGGRQTFEFLSTAVTAPLDLTNKADLIAYFGELRRQAELNAK